MELVKYESIETALVRVETNVDAPQNSWVPLLRYSIGTIIEKCYFMYSKYDWAFQLGGEYLFDTQEYVAFLIIVADKKVMGSHTFTIKMSQNIDDAWKGLYLEFMKCMQKRNIPRQLAETTQVKLIN